MVEWIAELRVVHLFGPDEPVFPATKRRLDAEGLFAADGVERTGWTSAAPIRAVFKTAFEGAGFSYANPHSLRRTLMRLAYDLNLSPREMKAWSQNLGHDNMMTSLTSYGTLSVADQVAAIRGIGDRIVSAPDDPAELATRLAAMLQNRAG